MSLEDNLGGSRRETITPANVRLPYDDITPSDVKVYVPTKTGQEKARRGILTTKMEKGVDYVFLTKIPYHDNKREEALQQLKRAIEIYYVRKHRRKK